MSVIFKIDELCHFNGTTIAELEKALGYSNGSLKRTSSQTVRSDRVQEIASFFDVTPTYLLSDTTHCVCPICAEAFNPLDQKEILIHKGLHSKFLKLQLKMGYLPNPIMAANIREKLIMKLKDPATPDNEKLHHYESLLLCDFTEYARRDNYVVNISYVDFVNNQIQNGKHFDLIPQTVIENIASKHNVDLSKDIMPLTDQFNTDNEFMRNVTDLWYLPKEFKKDVYKAIRHAKRDYDDIINQTKESEN